MAPGMAIADPRVGKLGLGLGLIGGRKVAVETAASSVAEEKLRRRNEELEREVRQSRETEEALRRDLERTKAKLRAVEDAEERLCAQLGDLEAEAVAQVRDYHRRIQDLSDQLARAHRIIKLSSSSSSW